ncbi:NADPH-dependent FMN reductase [Amycolatopsis thermophila]|uniref:NAD(P)H-dependent FMN reductase n=1 Tax=Amycolatopsis thermophila TaxID=206084 RepID=A0ABU0EU28_9PSEU|nr:NAD(P)H-dependent oxidoreductase [Amycolatopsis thermophila]MDQ0378809.1 NAD(P)H-dependent FMN reductase [Amycolatopsis thermophila]
MTELHLAVIIGSVRQQRFGPVVANWFLDAAARHGRFTVDLIDVADVPLPLALPAGPGEPVPPELHDVSARLDRADAFVVVTPEYNHSYPAALKHLIDWHHTEWHAKPVGFVSYGGLGGGLRAVEHLRQVFAETHSVTVRDGVSFDQHWAKFGTDGRLLDPEGPDGAAKTLLDELVWWAEALQNARARRPYAER